MEKHVNLAFVISRVCEKYDWRFLEVGTKDHTLFKIFSSNDGDNTMFDITILKSGFVRVSDCDRKEIILAAYHQAWEDEYAVTVAGPIKLTGCFCSNPECEFKFDCPTLSCGVKRGSYVDRDGMLCWSKCDKCLY